MFGKILNAANKYLKVTNFNEGSAETLSALPLGAKENNATGEVGVKVHVISASGSATGSEAVSGASVSASGTVAAGKLSVAFLPSEDFVGQIASVAVTGTEIATLQFSAASGNKLNAINYVVTSGSLKIFFSE